MPLWANVHPHLTYILLFLLVSCLPQSFDVEMLSFLLPY